MCSLIRGSTVGKPKTKKLMELQINLHSADKKLKSAQNGVADFN